MHHSMLVIKKGYMEEGWQFEILLHSLKQEFRYGMRECQKKTGGGCSGKLYKTRQRCVTFTYSGECYFNHVKVCDICFCNLC